MMKGAGVTLAIVAALAGCDKAPGGASVGGSQASTTTQTQQLDRSRTMSTAKTSSAVIEMNASALIFPALEVPIQTPQLDRQIAREGLAAISGDPAQRVRVLLSLAARPLPAWPVNPMADGQGAKQWAGVMAAAIQTAQDVGEGIAQQLGARTLNDAEEGRAFVLKAFGQIDHTTMLAQAEELASKPGVVLDLADASGVRFVGPRGVVYIDGGGVTVSSGGSQQYGPGVLNGKAYKLAMATEAAQGMTRTSNAGAGQAMQNSQQADATAGLK